LQPPVTDGSARPLGRRRPLGFPWFGFRDESSQAALPAWRRELGALYQAAAIGSGTAADARGTVALADDSTWTD